MSMESNEKIMSSQESLKIISDMISKTKVNIQQSSFHLLFWGWLITFISLSEYFISIFTAFENPWLVWLLTIPGVFVSLIYGFMNKSNQGVSTYAERIYMWVWLAFLVTVSLLILYFGFDNLMHKVGLYILLIAGFAVFVSGTIIKFKALIVGGMSMWAFSIIGFFAGPAIAPLAIPAAILCGYLIPGYILKKSESQNGKI